ncbi:hypothetical protein PMZ80_009932 [Knufia obscura]|uniref:Uncharacterized protein n=1 Tax=Knufia obscura TaxID=1635080 RepID=A0ABR0RC16_9EURO|nr:hypothetical protein PMZ80_009932 [Knufia obscura]
MRPGSVPSNQTYRLTGALIDIIKDSTDVRFNLAWTYGEFLNDAAQRLGTSEVLDASIMALVTAHAAICTRRKDRTTALVQYSNALCTLRRTLDDPVKACHANTLCAIVVLLLCQGMNGAEGSRWTGHCEGAAQILRVRGFYNPNDAFERKILLCLRGPVLFESMFNERIDLSPQEWRLLVDASFREATPEDEMMRCISHLRDFLRQYRKARHDQGVLLDLVSELQVHYRTMQGLLADQRERLGAYEADNAAHFKSSITTRVHSGYQSAFGVGLVIAIAYNCVLSGLSPDDTGLISDSASFVADVLDLAKNACRYRPLGSSYIALCLGAAWVGTMDVNAKLAVERAWDDYGGDFAPGLEKPPIAELEWTTRQLRLQDADPGQPASPLDLPRFVLGAA